MVGPAVTIALPGAGWSGRGKLAHAVTLLAAAWGGVRVAGAAACRDDDTEGRPPGAGPERVRATGRAVGPPFRFRDGVSGRARAGVGPEVRGGLSVQGVSACGCGRWRCAG